jgi:hypothetical protein
VGGGARARAGRRVPGGGGPRPGRRLLLRPGGPEPPAPAGDRRPGPVGGEPEAGGPTAGTALFAAAGGLPAEDARLAEDSHAFDPRYRLPPDRAAGLSFFRDHYLRTADDWRRIDADWLGAAAQLALDLDAAVNDAGLALAVELAPGGPVLLVPGDAPAAWSAWPGLSWPGRGPGDPPVTGADLLDRTALLRVGQHGGDAATPGAGGLARLADPGLVALVAVDRAAAAGRGWAMPAPALLDRLSRKARGRVLCSDAGVPERPEGVGGGEWGAFTARVVEAPGGLFLDYTL